MKKMTFGCTLLIMGTLVAEYFLGGAIPLWLIGSVFVLISFLGDKKDK